MARQSSDDKELDDMTECSICTEVFTDPRVLPCIHTFCLQCLLNYGKDKQPGESMACPLCREEFTITVNGLSGTPKNFTMEKLIQVGLRGKHSAEQEARERITPDALRRLAATNTEKVTNVLVMTEGVHQRLDEEKNDVIKHLAGIEDEINSEADKSIDAIERDRMKLLSKVKSIRLKRVKQLERVKQEVEQHMTELESFKRYSETLLSSETASDATRSANSLYDRADKLMKFDVIDHVDNSVSPRNVTFTPFTLTGRNVRNLVGTLTEGGQFKQMIEMKT